ncbi:HIG1 domain family member 1A, mitochondrial-like [Toxorhynchites rutilus septentrionalis]|uniref:HIG1 domain family member 1A, mitochondrial-like n=1 Tax=Toxorhynchites rutilus septentrionalis TaxID=329112 RepID=UPI002479C6D9|nr:HIG1 domain family member 1A, mitochondrial-like [Toxorhynchites rutilus septentrionalis]
MTQAMLTVQNFEESIGDKLIRKAREYPFVPIGLAGLAIVCGIGVYKFRNRGLIPSSVYLMQLRVAAQGTMVAALMVGLGGTMVNEYLFGAARSEKPRSFEMTQRDHLLMESLMGVF